MKELKNTTKHDQAIEVLTDLCEVIDRTGGVVEIDGMIDGCVGDPEWLDLADTYMNACHVLGRTPVIEQRNSEEAWR